MNFALVFCLIGIIALEPAFAQPNDPTYNGLFSVTNAPPYTHPDDYIQPENKQDEFDWKLTKTLFTQDKSENIIVSPLSVKILLTLLAEAAGQSITSLTRKQLEQVLPYKKSLFDAKEYFKNIFRSLNVKDDLYTVNIGTKMFVDSDVSVNQRFHAIASSNYEADVQTLNFANARESVGVINKWVKDITNGRLSDLVSEESVSQAIVLLVNALYFEGTWRYAFNKTLTRDFFVGPNKKVSKQFMEQTGDFYYFYSNHFNAKILRLPYNGRRYSMFIILPNAVDGVDDVISRLDSEGIKNEVWHMDEVEVHVVMPKFKFDSSLNLNEVVKTLGITEIFENNATLSLLARGGNSEGKLKVSNIIQKSGIVVDEKGTVAWAASEIELVNKFGGEPREFIVDRPFLFYIEDDTTGAKLFNGRVGNPKY